MATTTISKLIQDSKEAIMYNWKEGHIHWGMVMYFAWVHVEALYGLTLLSSAKWQTLLLTFALWPLTGIGITAGAHRLWSHRSYKASTPYKILMMSIFSMSFQDSILWWACGHRVHHKYSDTAKDPHDATRGFFYSHMGWNLLHPSKEQQEALDATDVSDLRNDPIVMFQHYLNPFFNIFMCTLPSVIAVYGWGEDMVIAHAIPCTLRTVFVLHCTWFVNSLNHAFGERPYDSTIAARENWFVAVLAVGEGWHNWHHKYPYDYATSEHGALRQWNPTKAWIDFFALLGMVTDRKRATGAWGMSKLNNSNPVKEGEVPQGA